MDLKKYFSCYNSVMQFHIISVFPETLQTYATSSILGRAQQKRLLKINFYGLLDFTAPRKRVDDIPYGGGPGMVLSVGPVMRAMDQLFKKIKKRKDFTKTLIIIPKPGAKQFTNRDAKSLSKNYSDIIFIAGRYEGIDERVKKIFKAKEFAIGELIVSGGELPAMMMVDAISRQISGVLGDSESLEESRASSSAVYTRPASYIYAGKKYSVPAVLRSGHHSKIELWRKKQNKK